MLLLEDFGEVVSDSLVEVFTTKVSVTGCSEHLEDAVVNCEDRHVKCATTKIVHKDVLLTAFLVKAVGNGSGRGLVNDANHIKSSDSASVFSRLSLRIVEVCRYSNNSVLDLLSKIVLSSFLHLREHHRGDFFRGELLSACVVRHGNWHVRLVILRLNIIRKPLHILLHLFVIESSANESLSNVDGVLGVHAGLVLG